MSDWFVYIIETHKGKYYTGISKDPERRFYEHLLDFKKGAKFFRSDSPLKIVYLELCENYSVALKREYSIKKLNRLKKGELISTFTFSAIDK
jgi:putative endonuclease